jgi:hypothetical protein
LTLSGTAIASTNLTTGEVVVNSGTTSGAMVYTGAYSASTAYNVGEVMYDTGGINIYTYVCIVATVPGQNPTTNPDNWDPIGIIA